MWKEKSCHDSDKILKMRGKKRERDRGARTHKKTMTDHERRKKMNRIMENA